MKIKSRKMLDHSFTGMGFISVGLMGVVLLVILLPIVYRGAQAYIFTETIEHRRFQNEKFQRGDAQELAEEYRAVKAARLPVYEAIEKFEAKKREWPKDKKREFRSELKAVKKALHHLLGPAPGEKTPVLMRQQFGQTRWDRAQVKLHEVLYREDWVEDPTGQTKELVQVFVPRVDLFKGTELEPMFEYTEKNVELMLRPKLTFYWQFLIDRSYDAHFFGGIGPEVRGTLLLTLGAIVFAIPFGIIAAIYLCEYAKPSKTVHVLRSCINTLAGVPSIVFGLFGLAFFLNTLKLTESKSVLAGSMTLSLMILPTIIRASEEAIMAVPFAYKEASMGLGAGKWRTICKVILPAALPGILTGIVLSMGRAAGETAPIIFTAAVSVGDKLPLTEAFFAPSQALPWNIYNLCSEHEAVDSIRHVQYGMVFTLIAMVLLLNMLAIVFRARLHSKTKGV